jgi:hypothetical protein
MHAPPVVMGNAAGLVTSQADRDLFRPRMAIRPGAPDAPRVGFRRGDEWYRFHPSKDAIFRGFARQVYRSGARCVGWF